MPKPIRECTVVDEGLIPREALADKRPAILRGLVKSWPAVAAARESPGALVRYLSSFDTGAAVDALLAPPEIDGRIFYNESMTGFNFVRNRLPLTAVAEQVLRYSLFPKAPSVAVQSALIRDCAPGFLAENRLGLLDEGIAPRLWFGNRITTPLHLDAYDNVACVVAGRRRFTLFPPEQIGNLYVGPIDFAPTGAPMSLVRVHDPDFDRFPKYREALATRQVAELAPGDAIVIPPLWWHHVETLESFNLLVNYWWQDRGGRHTKADSAFDALLHGILCIRDLPPPTRRAWAALFEHYLFGPQADAVAHIPAERRGILGDLSEQQIDGLRTQIAKRS